MRVVFHFMFSVCVVIYDGDVGNFDSNEVRNGFFFSILGVLKLADSQKITRS